MLYKLLAFISKIRQESAHSIALQMVKIPFWFNVLGSVNCNLISCGRGWNPRGHGGKSRDGGADGDQEQEGREGLQQAQG